MTKLQSNHIFYKSDIKPDIDHSNTNRLKHSPGPNSKQYVRRSYTQQQ